jgi:hypothetical protein
MEIDGALKYLKNNKAVRADSIAAELFSRPGLAKHYREAGPRGFCVQCTRRAINSIFKNYRGICLLNVTYKV